MDSFGQEDIARAEAGAATREMIAEIERCAEVLAVSLTEDLGLPDGLKVTFDTSPLCAQ